MSQTFFSAEKFIHFDLDTGAIRSLGEEPLALVPLDVIAAMEPCETLTVAARKWGEIHGNRLAANIEVTGGAAGMDALTDHLSGTLAVFGMGKMSIEISGQALMFRLDSKDGDISPGLTALCTGFLTGYVGAVSKKSFEVLSLGQHRNERIFWAGNSSAVKKVRMWIDEGAKPLAAIDRLAQGGE